MFERIRSPFVVIDLETTGLRSGKDRIVEVGVVKLDPQKLREIDRFDTLVKPDDLSDLDIASDSIGATGIHGITPKMLEQAPKFQEIALRLASFLQDSVYVVHNAHFDLRFLQAEFERCRYAMLPGVGCDTYVETGMSLSDACYQHGIDNPAPHRAICDAETTATLLRHIARRRLRRFKPITFLQRQAPAPRRRLAAALKQQHPPAQSWQPPPPLLLSRETGFNLDALESEDE